MLLKYPAHNSLPLDPGSLMFSQNGLMSLVSYFIICVCVSENLHSLSIRLWKHFFVAAYSLNKKNRNRNRALLKLISKMVKFNH